MLREHNEKNASQETHLRPVCANASTRQMITHM
jgi:hypothetical protein